MIRFSVFAIFAALIVVCYHTIPLIAAQNDAKPFDTLEQYINSQAKSMNRNAVLPLRDGILIRFWPESSSNQCVLEKPVVIGTCNEKFAFFAQADKELHPLPIPKPVVKRIIPRKPVIRALMPYIYENKNGRRVCNQGSKDKPSKSKKGKGKHMDMECCLDPDEYPNPNCYYPSSKYGKYL